MKKWLVIALLALPSIVKGANDQGSSYTDFWGLELYRKSPSYKGKEITPTSIVTFMNQDFPIPLRLKGPVNTFIKEYNPVLLELMRSRYQNAQWKKEDKENKQLIAQAGLNNIYEYGTYGLEIPGTDYVAVIAGPEHRINNLLTQVDVPHYDVITRDPIQKRTPEQVTSILNSLPHKVTHQGASRAAFYLLAQDIIKKDHLEDIAINDLYLITNPAARRPQYANDADHFIVERKAPGTPFDLKDDSEELNKIINAEILGKISNKAWFSLFIIALKTSYMWDGLKMYVNVMPDGSLLIHNVQQANSIAPKEFMNKKILRNDVYSGLGVAEVLNASKNDPVKYDMIKNYIQTHPELPIQVRALVQ